MALVKVIREEYFFESDVIKLIHYIADINKCPNLICGGAAVIDTGSVFENPDEVAKQFIEIQKGKRCSRRIYHVVISFDRILDAPDNKLLNRIGQAVAYMYPGYQSLFTVHEDTGYLHIHIAFNNCSIFNGEPNLTKSFNPYSVTELVDRIIDSNLGII